MYLYEYIDIYIHLIPLVNKGGAILVPFCVLSSGRATLSVIVQWHNTLAILVKMTSIISSVRGCHNNWNKRRVSLQRYCVVRRKTRAECCGATFNLHPPPSSDEDRRMLLKVLNLKSPPQKPYSILFILWTADHQTNTHTPRNGWDMLFLW